jgi:L,D-transpeptidase catalytic domain
MGVGRHLFALASLAALGAAAPGCHRTPPVEAQQPAVQEADDPAEPPAPTLTAKKDAPRIAALALETHIYERPDTKSRVLGYFRLGQTLARSEQPVGGCWYQVAPRGYVCVGETSALPKDEGGATLDLEHPIIKALGVKPDLSKPMPYLYGFVRRDATLWHMVPDKKQMDRWEWCWDGMIKEYKKHKRFWNRIDAAGANQVPLDDQGNAKMLPKDVPHDPPVVDDAHVFPDYGDGTIPWWLKWEGPHPKRRIPNISSYQAAEDYVPRGKVLRHAGLAVIGSFTSEHRSAFRKFTVALDGRLIGEEKIKPHYASAFHGIPLGPDTVEFPFAMIRRREAYKYGDSGTRPGDALAFRDIIPLTGKSELRGENYFYQTKAGYWLRESEAGIFTGQAAPPKAFDWKKTKWIDVSIVFQTLVMYEGDKPVYATLVSTGIDGLGDPYTTKSTIQGEFKIDWKHITTTMDADDPESHFELRDVPWVQYFEGGFALHGAYWHDDFGKPRSHGCVNMAPVDARRVFFWTDPPLPEGWHGVHSGKSMGEGTWVRVRK